MWPFNSRKSRSERIEQSDKKTEWHDFEVARVVGRANGTRWTEMEEGMTFDCHHLRPTEVTAYARTE